MDERQAKNTVTMDLNNTSVPAVIASLEMLTVDNNYPSSTETKRVLRKRTPKLTTEISNRRCSLKPKKRTFTEMNSLENVKEYYLNKSVKKTPNNLETIYEESDNSTDDSIHMSVKRFKRMLMFKSEPTASKLKKRRAKIQKVFGSKLSYKHKCASMKMLLDKLNRMKANSPMKVNYEFNPY